MGVQVGAEAQSLHVRGKVPKHSTVVRSISLNTRLGHPAHRPEVLDFLLQDAREDVFCFLLAGSSFKSMTIIKTTVVLHSTTK
jgi:hypothetical protein